MFSSSLFAAGILLVCLGRGLSEDGIYSGHKVIRIAAAFGEDLDTLTHFLANQTQFNVWRYPSSMRPLLDIQLPPNEYELFTPWLGKMGFQYSVLIQDLQTLIDQEKEQQQRPSRSNGFDYGKYYPFGEIQKWMETMIGNYGPNATKFFVGKSREGKPIAGIKISTKSTEGTKPAVWIQGGVHGREWISPATILYMTYRMLRGLKHETSIAEMMEKFDWYILPIVNPDGYTYTWEKDRMWSKTRWCKSHFVPYFPYHENTCRGTDPNRNWNSHWCVVGGSRQPKSEEFCGDSAFSEPSVKAISVFLRTINTKVFLDLQSYGQMWLTPWGYTKDQTADFKQQKAAAEAASKAIAETGTVYAHGSMGYVKGLQSGTALDWVYGVLGVKYSYQVELRDTGKHGYLLPADQIIRTGRETLEGIRALIKFITSDNTTAFAEEMFWEY